MQGLIYVHDSNPGYRRRTTRGSNLRGCSNPSFMIAFAKLPALKEALPGAKGKYIWITYRMVAVKQWHRFTAFA
jgi:hypothetical protein